MQMLCPEKLNPKPCEEPREQSQPHIQLQQCILSLMQNKPLLHS